MRTLPDPWGEGIGTNTLSCKSGLLCSSADSTERGRAAVSSLLLASNFTARTRGECTTGPYSVDSLRTPACIGQEHPRHLIRARSQLSQAARALGRRSAQLPSSSQLGGSSGICGNGAQDQQDSPRAVLSGIAPLQATYPPAQSAARFASPTGSQASGIVSTLWRGKSKRNELPRAARTAGKAGHQWSLITASSPARSEGAIGEATAFTRCGLAYPDPPLG